MWNWFFIHLMLLKFIKNLSWKYCYYSLLLIISLTDILFINCALQEFTSIIVLCFCFLLSFHCVVVYVFLVRRNLSIPYYLLSCLFTFLHLFFLFLLIFAASCLLTSVVSPRYPLNVPQRNWSDFSTNFLPDLIGWLLNIFAWE